MALGTPNCAFFRRRKAPKALSERCRALAAKPSTPSIRGQIHPGHPVQMCSDVEAGRIALAALVDMGWRRPADAAILQPFQLGFNLPVALADLVVIEPVQFQGLGQHEDVLLPPVPLQRLGDGGLIRLDPVVAQSGQLARVPFPVHDSLDNRHGGLAGVRCHELCTSNRRNRQEL